MSSTETYTFGMSSSVIGTSTVCCVEVSVKRSCRRMPSRSTVSSAVAVSHGDWIITRAVSPGFQVFFSGSSVMRL